MSARSDAWTDEPGCECDAHDVIAAMTCPVHADDVQAEPSWWWIRDLLCIVAFVVGLWLLAVVWGVG